MSSGNDTPSPIKLEITQVQGVDEIGDLVFTVTAFDEACATVTLEQTVYTAESWKETSLAVLIALRSVIYGKLEAVDSDTGNAEDET